MANFEIFCETISLCINLFISEEYGPQYHVHCLTSNIQHKLFHISYVFMYFRPQEIFNWLLLVDDRDYDVWDQPRISWHIKYQRPEKIRENDQVF